MGRTALASLLAVTALAASAAAQPEAAPRAVLDRLPPGIRPPAERSALAFPRSGQGGEPGARMIEVVRGPAADAGGQDWVQVEYTIDPALDERVRSVLAEGPVPLGHVILMDPATGDVLSYVSTDPERFPATRTYPTASLMKVVTAAAVLRHLPEAAGRDCRYAGSPYRVRAASLGPLAGGGRFDSFWHAIAVSNNQCFARLAVRDVGEEALLAEIARVGLLEPPAARHPAGRVEPIEDPLDLGYLGSGLAGSFITPLAGARLAALLAGGELVRPRWIARVRNAYGDPLAVPAPPAPRRVWSPDLAGELRELLVNVTERGTARRAFRDENGAPRLGPIRVPGKTGTLRGTEPEGLYQWFIGVAPAEAPRLAIAVVVVDGPRSASQVAAAVLREVLCGADACADPGALPALRARGAGQEGEAVTAQDLDAIPQPIGVSGLEFPRRLRRQRVSGEIVLLLELDPAGSVLDVRVDSSDLPQFDEFVSNEVRSWRFTPPTRRGRPVRAHARLPIPIVIE